MGVQGPYETGRTSGERRHHLRFLLALPFHGRSCDHELRRLEQLDLGNIGLRAIDLFARQDERFVGHVYREQVRDMRALDLESDGLAAIEVDSFIEVLPALVAG